MKEPEQTEKKENSEILQDFNNVLHWANERDGDRAISRSELRDKIS